MHWLWPISLLATVAEITSYYAEEKVLNYFRGDIVAQFNDIWSKHRIAYQNTLEQAMQEAVGYKDMNVYIERPLNPYLVSKGYYHTDNHVHLVLENLNLDSIPRIYDPKISLLLPNNVIKLEASVSRIIVHANYMLFRNTSNVVYALQDQDPFKMSPFLFQQVQNLGQVALSIDGCKLSGIGLTSLVGRSVHLGYNLFRLQNCQYSVEIFTPGIASPPVVSSYFPIGKGLCLNYLLMKSISAELIPKLQAALFSHVNSSAILEENLLAIRLEQQKIYEITSNYANNIVRNINMLTITRKLGMIVMNNLSISWDDTFDEGVKDSTIMLNDIVMTGLETAYSAHTGGPFKLASDKISEEIRFGTLQVRGTLEVEAGGLTKEMDDFAVEIADVVVDVTVNIDPATSQNEPSKSVHLVEVMGWRSLHFSSPGMTFMAGESLVTGYLLNEVPEILTKYLRDIIQEAAREADDEYRSALGKITHESDRNPRLDGGLYNVNDDENLEPESKANNDQDNIESDNNSSNIQNNLESDGNVNNGDGSFGSDGNTYKDQTIFEDNMGNFNDDQSNVGPGTDYEQDVPVSNPEDGDFGTRTSVLLMDIDGLRDSSLNLSNGQVVVDQAGNNGGRPKKHLYKKNDFYDHGINLLPSWKYPKPRRNSSLAVQKIPQKIINWKERDRW